MKTQTPALTASSLAQTAGKKARKIRRKLDTAEAELQATNRMLARPPPHMPASEVAQALKHNTAAAAEVHEATEELDVVAELLDDAHALQDLETGLDGETQPAGHGKSGEGARSALPHLRNQNSTKG